MNTGMETVDEEDHMPPAPPRFTQPVHEEQPPDQSFAPLDPLQYFDEHRVLETARGKFSIYTGGKIGSVIYVFIHGAGYSALSFAEVVKFLKREAFCIAVDLRSHGSSCPGELEFQAMVDDLDRIFDDFFPEPIPAVLFGHSLGGSLITAITSSKLLVQATVLIDISEAVALQSLPNMQSFLRKKPKAYQGPGQMA